MPAPEIVGQRLHLLLHIGHRILYGPKTKGGIAGTQAQRPPPLGPRCTAVTHPAAATARRRPTLAAAARTGAAGCQDAGDGTSSPENQTCYPPGIHQGRGRRAPRGRGEEKANRGAKGPSLREGLPRALFPRSKPLREQGKETLTRDWGATPRPRRHLPNVSRWFRSLAVAMAPEVKRKRKRRCL